jgi:GNAT superfamily N-acetyltransferase
MADITRFSDDDQRPVLGLYRRVFGADAADAIRLRWDWQYRRNPSAPATSPLAWVAREGPTVIGQFATMPVRLSVKGTEIQAAWGMDVCVTPERQRQGLGAVLCQVWDHNVGAALGLGLSEASLQLLRTLRWPSVGPVPLLVKPLTRRAVRRPGWPMWINRFVSAVTLPVVRVIARAKPLHADVVPVRQFGNEFTALWDRLAPRFDFIVRRDAAYLNWRFVEPPHVRYCCVALRRDDEVQGYAVYRHLREPRGKVTLLVDFLADPDDEAGFETLLRWVDREARAADSDKVRVLCQHHGLRHIMRRSGYFQIKSGIEFVAKVNAIELPPDFYGHTRNWHVTLGDSDQDR